MKFDRLVVAAAVAVLSIAGAPSCRRRAVAQYRHHLHRRSGVRRRRLLRRARDSRRPTSIASLEKERGSPTSTSRSRSARRRGRRLLTGCYSQPHRHPRRARAQSHARHRRRRDDARRAAQEPAATPPAWPASGTSAIIRSSCRCTTVSTSTSACPIPTTCGRPITRRRSPATYPHLPLIEGDRIVDPEVTAEDQTQADDAVHRASRVVHRSPQGSAVLLLPRALDAARAAPRQREASRASRSRASMAT